MKEQEQTELQLPAKSVFRRISDNAISLFALQGLTYLLTFLSTPYLLRTLGVWHYGAFALANTVTAQFILLTDFGFASSATRLTAIQASKNIPLGPLFGAVMAVKFLLLLVAALCCLALVICVPRFRATEALLAIAFLQVLGSVLFPSWLFQGLERMRLITSISVGARIVSVALIFAVVHSASDASLAMACQSAGVLLQGVIALLFAVTVLRIRPEIPTWKAMGVQLKESFHPFLGASLGNLVGGSSVVFMGMFQNLTAVGAYAAVERTARAEVMAMLPLSQAAYPYVSQQFHENLEQGNRVFRKLCVLLLSAAFLCFGTAALFSKQILLLLYGKELLPETHLFASFSIWAFLSLLNTLLGLHYLIGSGHSRQYGRSVFWSAITTVGLFLLCIPRFGATGALSAVVVGEIVQTSLMLIAIARINRGGSSNLFEGAA